MSGVAQICLDEGFAVSGSDIKHSETTDRLQQRGAVIHFPHSRSNVSGEAVVVISSAIPESNEELSYARQLGLTIKRRAEVLGWFMSSRVGISVAGCHGKTTTTSMVSSILTHAGLDPTTVVGGEASHVGGNAKFGKGEHLVAEADESDGSFLLLPSRYSIVTNVDNDHLDYYKSMEKVEQAFEQFVANTEICSVVCADQPVLQKFRHKYADKVRSYGMASGADYRIENVTLVEFGSTFQILHQDKELAFVELNVPGMHNVLNACAALAICHQMSVSPQISAEALNTFVGVQRRFERICEKNGVLIVDDYAHHPAEISVTLDAARRVADARGGKLVAVFQPHRYSRLSHLLQDFARSFSQVDFLYLAPVYAAGELRQAKVDSWFLYRELQMEKNMVSLLSDRPCVDSAQEILSELKSGDVLITLGAGDVTRLGRSLKSVEVRS